MGGALDRVKMCGAAQLGMDEEKMPRGNVFEFTDMTDEELDELGKEMLLDRELLAKRHAAEGHMVIKPRRTWRTRWGCAPRSSQRDTLALPSVRPAFETVAG